MGNKEFTPDRITELNPNEVFVFGSNLKGEHYGGAARTAASNFGAVHGRGSGLQGQGYAIPTLDSPDGNKLNLWVIQSYVDAFTAFAKRHTELKFYVTEIGCGIAGFTYEEIAPMFVECSYLDNVVLPKNFWRYYS